MKHEVKIEPGKMTESQVRDAIEKASRTARNIEMQKGRGDVSHEKMREYMIQNAERDRKDGKI